MAAQGDIDRRQFQATFDIAMVYLGRIVFDIPVAARYGDMLIALTLCRKLSRRAKNSRRRASSSLRGKDTLIVGVAADADACRRLVSGDDNDLISSLFIIVVFKWRNIHKPVPMASGHHPSRLRRNHRLGISISHDAKTFRFVDTFRQQHFAGNRYYLMPAYAQSFPIYGCSTPLT